MVELQETLHIIQIVLLILGTVIVLAAVLYEFIWIIGPASEEEELGIIYLLRIGYSFIAITFVAGIGRNLRSKDYTAVFIDLGILLYVLYLTYKEVKKESKIRGKE